MGRKISSDSNAFGDRGTDQRTDYSMYKPIAEDNNTVICALMNLYRTYYRIIGAIIAAVGLLLTPFIPKLISGDVPQGINIYVKRKGAYTWNL